METLIKAYVSIMNFFFAFYIYIIFSGVFIVLPQGSDTLII